MKPEDLEDAADFFKSRLRGVKKASKTKLRRWALHKLRTDAQATAELMLEKGYRAAYLYYFIEYHVFDASNSDVGGALSIVLADLHSAAKRLHQPYRDLAAVCFRWGYPHRKVLELLEGALQDETSERRVAEHSASGGH